jgi:hypothetical protein
VRSKAKYSKKSLVVPGKPLLAEELLEHIKRAEKGTFKSVQELKKKIAKWKRKRGK